MTFQAAFYKGTRPGWQGIYSRLVRWIGKGAYSHCEILFSDGMAASASYIDKGVRFKRIEFNPENWDFIDLPASLEAAAREWFVLHNGARYDWRGNVWFVIPWITHSKSKWFCSEALAAALGFAEPWRYEPNEIAIALRSVQQEAL